jgi:hypothetical protein
VSSRCGGRRPWRTCLLPQQLGPGALAQVLRRQLFARFVQRDAVDGGDRLRLAVAAASQVQPSGAAAAHAGLRVSKSERACGMAVAAPAGRGAPGATMRRFVRTTW